MSGRKLSRRQAWRVEKIQEERLARAQRKTERLASRDTTQLGEEQVGLVVANFGALLHVEGKDGAVHPCKQRQNIEAVVVGDEVVWQADPHGGGVVTAPLPRRSLLARPDPSGELRPIAANVDQILVVTAPAPIYSSSLIDQYLIAAEATGITPILLFNKIDLLSDEAHEAQQAQFKLYRQLGYQVIFASTRSNHGLDELRETLRSKNSVFIGQSGVGKSSLVQALLPEESIMVGELSEQSGLGQHTTTTARLYHLPEGGNLIDSPGVRGFRIWRMEPHEIARGFREFLPYLGRCKFRNCSHRHEPGCALLEAVERNEISAERLTSFHRIVDEQENYKLRYE